MRISRQHLQYVFGALVLAIMCLVVWQTADPLTSPPEALPGPGYSIEITQSALQHVIDRHTVGGTMNAFGAGEDIRAIIHRAESMEPKPQARGNYQRVVDAGRQANRQTNERLHGNNDGFGQASHSLSGSALGWSGT